MGHRRLRSIVPLHGAQEQIRRPRRADDGATRPITSGVLLDQSSDERREVLERLGWKPSIKSVMIELLTEFHGEIEPLVAPESFANVAIAPGVIAEVIQLEFSVVQYHPMQVLR